MVELGLGGGRGHVEVMFLLSVAVVVSPVRVHGFHVFLGTIMLLVIAFRIYRDDFTIERHFAFEAVSWYWHFVDVIWLLLFVFVYWL